MFQILIGENNKPIYRIKAVRQEDLTDKDGLYDYEVNWTDEKKREYGPAFVEHRYSDGALVLAEKIIRAIFPPR